MQHTDGRNLAIWRGIHRTFFHLDRTVGESVLLSLRISISRFLHPCNLVLADIDSHGLFPIMWRGEYDRNIKSDQATLSLFFLM